MRLLSRRTVGSTARLAAIPALVAAVLVSMSTPVHAGAREGEPDRPAAAPLEVPSPPPGRYRMITHSYDETRCDGSPEICGKWRYRASFDRAESLGTLYIDPAVVEAEPVQVRPTVTVQPGCTAPAPPQDQQDRYVRAQISSAGYPTRNVTTSFPWHTGVYSVSHHYVCHPSTGAGAWHTHIHGVEHIGWRPDVVDGVAPTEYDCGDGFRIYEYEVPSLIADLEALAPLTPAARAAVEAQPCAFPAFLLSVVDDPAPAPASLEVAGPGAPIGGFAVPAARRDGCPLYQREVKYVLGRGLAAELTDRFRDRQVRFLGPINWLIERFFRSRADVQWAGGDVLVTLKLSAAVCTNGQRITAVTPPPGGLPGAEYLATAKGQLVGFKQPTGLLAHSHNFVDPPNNATFQTRAVVSFVWTSALGIELPVEFAAQRLEARITVYRDGTWDYATLGGGTFPPQPPS